MQEQMNSMNDFSRSGIESQWKVSRFQSTCDDSERGATTNACHLTHGIHLEHRKTFLVMNFLHLIHPEIILMEFILAQHQERQDQFHKQQEQGPYSQEMTNNIEAQFQCRHLQRRGRK